MPGKQAKFVSPLMLAHAASGVRVGDPARDRAMILLSVKAGARIVAAAGNGKAATGRGANLLFYGPPGTGKSEFAKIRTATLIQRTNGVIGPFQHITFDEIR